MVPVVVAGGVLGRSPADAAALAGNHDDFRPRLEEAAVDQAGAHPKRPQSTNVNGLELDGEVEVLQRLELLHEVPRVVDEDVDRAALDLGGDSLALRVVGYVDPLDNLGGIESLELGAAGPDDRHELGPGFGKLLGQRQPDAPVGAGHGDPLALEEGGVVHGRDVKVPLVVLPLGPGEPSRLVGNRVHSRRRVVVATGGAHGSRRVNQRRCRCRRAAKKCLGVLAGEG